MMIFTFSESSRISRAGRESQFVMIKLHCEIRVGIHHSLITARVDSSSRKGFKMLYV